MELRRQVDHSNILQLQMDSFTLNVFNEAPQVLSKDFRWHRHHHFLSKTPNTHSNAVPNQFHSERAPLLLQ